MMANPATTCIQSQGSTTQVPVQAGPVPSLGALLRVPGFLRLVAGNGIALSGHKLQSIVFAWLVLESTGSKLSLGLVVGAPAAIVVFASLLGGILADYPKAQRTLRVTRLAMAMSAGAAGVLVSSGNAGIAFLVVGSLVTVSLTAVDMPVSRTLVFDLVGKDRALPGTALNSMATNLYTTAGPLAVGVLIERFGAGMALYTIAATYALAAALVPRVGRGAVATPASALEDLRAGCAYIRETPCVAWLVGLFFLVPVAGVFFAMIPVYAHEVLKSGPAGLGMLMAVYGAGTVTGSSYLSFSGRLRRAGRLVSVTGVLFGAGVIAFGVSGSMLVSSVLAFSLGVLAMLWQNTLTASLQTAAAPEMKGRAMSIGTMGIQLMSLGWLVAGAASTLFGPAATVIASGIAFAGLSLFAVLRSAELRAID